MHATATAKLTVHLNPFPTLFTLIKHNIPRIGYAIARF